MKRHLPLLTLVVICGISLRVFSADEVSRSITVTVADQPAASWSVDRIKHDLADDIKAVDFDVHGTHHTGKGVPLLSVLAKSGCPADIKMNPAADPKTKLPELRMVVLVHAKDGYAVAFSLAELLPQIGNHPAWLLIEQDGQPLTDRDAPMRLVDPTDSMPARGIHAIDSIEVSTVMPSTATPSTQPTK
jgi:hypothetical protein